MKTLAAIVLSVALIFGFVSTASASVAPTPTFKLYNQKASNENFIAYSKRDCQGQAWLVRRGKASWGVASWNTVNTHRYKSITSGKSSKYVQISAGRCINPDPRKDPRKTSYSGLIYRGKI